MKTQKKTTKKTCSPKRTTTKKKVASKKPRKMIPGPVRPPDYEPTGNYCAMNPTIPESDEYPLYGGECCCGKSITPEDKYVTTNYYYTVDEETKEKFVLAGLDLEFDDAVTIAQIMTQSKVRVTPIGSILAFVLTRIIRIQEIDTQIHKSYL